tara:strand:- start:28 stop:237 length:210 start_codon:yes stop_codon:yes gene_type:complete
MYTLDKQTIGEQVRWEVAQIEEAVDYYVELWESVQSEETKYDLEIKIKKLKSKARKLKGENVQASGKMG